MIAGLELIAVRPGTGFHVLEGPSPLLGGEDHWQHFEVLKNVSDRLSLENFRRVDQQVFEAYLQTTWGVLGLISPTNVMWMVPKERHAPFVRAVLERWEELDAEGVRYTMGSRTPSGLWVLPTNVQYALFHLGVDKERLKRGVEVEMLREVLGARTMKARWMIHGRYRDVDRRCRSWVLAAPQLGVYACPLSRSSKFVITRSGRQKYIPDLHRPGHDSRAFCRHHLSAVSEYSVYFSYLLHVTLVALITLLKAALLKFCAPSNAT